MNIITTTIQTENVINDAYRVDAWEIHSDDIASAIYVDGLFKGMGFFAGEEGQILKIKKDVELLDKDGNIIRASYKGVFGKLLDASLYERGSALKPSMMQIIIYSLIALTMGFMAGMSYGK